ncbi:hypothetical protein CPB86DRAFT_826510 [Serendipita vermifera]|nr:hypothetical protein CPB86DRAFT_826510 [Serendipita vermifera]
MAATRIPDGQMLLRRLTRTPRKDPSLISHFLFNSIPPANLAWPNRPSNSEALCSLDYIFSITPKCSHPWLVFRLVQWEALRAGEGIDVLATADPCPFVFPPSPASMSISKFIIDTWNALGQEEICEWEELVRDIRNVYTQLTARFGNGVVFDENTWEDQRYYHARSLFFKWVGYQTFHDTTRTNETAAFEVVGGGREEKHYDALWCGTPY